MFDNDPDFYEKQHRELAQQAPDGPILEFGVGHGASARTWAYTGRPVYGFDTFAGFPMEDVLELDAFPDWGDRPAYVPDDLDRLAASLPNTTLIKGKVQDTLDPFLARHPDLKAGIVNLDVDLYLPTVYILERLIQFTKPGSVIISDQYYQKVCFKAERLAVDEFLARHPGQFSGVEPLGRNAGVFRRLI